MYWSDIRQSLDEMPAPQVIVPPSPFVFAWAGPTVETVVGRFLTPFHQVFHTFYRIGDMPGVMNLHASGLDAGQQFGVL